MFSFNFEEILPSQLSEDKEREHALLVDAAAKIERSGADLLVICSSTTNMLADTIQSRVNIPVISMTDAIADYCVENRLFRVGLLGTRRVMYGQFLRDALEMRGIESVVPPLEMGDEVNRIIYEELVINKFIKESEKKIAACVEALKLRSVEAVILGCTELPLLVKSKRCGVVMIDCIDAHINKAIKMIGSIQ